MSGNLQSHPESILIVRLGAMGDVLHAMPAVAALRKARPEATIGWVIERRWSELLISGDDGGAAMFGTYRLLDAVHSVDTRAWRKQFLLRGTWREMTTSIGSIRSENYQIAVDFQGAIKSSLVARLSGAKTIYGFANPRERAATLWYGKKIRATAAHVIDQNLQLASAFVEQPLTAAAAELPRSQRAEEWCERTLRERGLMHFAILNPGSGWGAKCWPGERYAAVAKRLRGAGLRSLINFGPGEESLAETMMRASEGAAELVSCDVAQLIALTRRASLFIGSDTGPMHLAAALKVPTVALFGPTDPARNGPYWTPSVMLRSDESVTSYKHVAQADIGLHSITVETAIAAASQVLGVPIG
jgi:heptosyltransferase-1